jgi:hypothetical protein
MAEPTIAMGIKTTLDASARGGVAPRPFGAAAIQIGRAGRALGRAPNVRHTLVVVGLARIHAHVFAVDLARYATSCLRMAHEV